MNHFEFDDIDEEYARARRGLHEALETVDNLEYAIGQGPLGLGEVVNDRLVDEDFQQVVTEFGWPSHMEDGLIEPVNSYSSTQEFMESLKPTDEYGRKHIASAYFFRLLAQPPIAEYAEATTGDGLLGVAPVLHRAHALAPELFGNLKQSLAKIGERYRIVDDVDRAYEALNEPANEEVMEAMHMAYRIMGRLLKVHDPEISAKKLGGVQGKHMGEEAVILNADDALRNG